MIPVVTTQEMAAMDSHAIHQLNIPGIILMENAGRGIAGVAQKMLGEPSGKIVHLYCGPGNNGGDGYVVARHLLNRGLVVKTIILSAADKIKGDALTNLKILQNMGHQPEFITTIPESLEMPHLFIDALLGTGVKGPLRGLYADAVEKMNDNDVPVLAIDIPTGVNADTGQVDGPAIQATVTATMALPKRGLLFSPGREHAGDLEIIDISMPAGMINERDPQVYRVDVNFVKSILPFRSPDAFKNRLGMIHVIAGSKGFTGAAALASQAALRAGAGLCYLTIPESLNTILETQSAEVITQPARDEDKGFLLSSSFDHLLEYLQSKSALVLGPGIGLHDETRALVHRLLDALSLPLVLDADGLNVCAGHTELLQRYKGDLILTPHPGELARLTGLSTTEIVTNRIDIARQYAGEWQCTLVLKGGPTVTARRSGRTYINSTGNAGMATAGSGDVLSGIIAGLIGQNVKTEDAAVAAVFIHGLAGDLASAQKGQMGMLAGDILNKIPVALKQLEDS